MKFKCHIILPFLVASLHAASVSDLTFVLNEAGTEYSITECNEFASGDLEIPSTYQGFAVTTVADKAFKDCASLTSIIIPDSVTTLGEESFFNTGITSIVVPDSVTSIGHSAFQNCISLTTVTLPDALTRIEWGTFINFAGGFGYPLTSINIPSNLEFIGGSAIPIAFEIPDSVTCYGPGNGGGFGFNGDPTVIFSGGFGYRLSSSGTNAYIVELEGMLSESLTLSGDIVIPQTIDGAAVQSVTFTGWMSNGNHAPGITSVTVSEGIVSIADAAFWGFEDLVSINLPDSLTFIDWVAFRGCTSLSSITIPKNVSEIGGSVFNGASNLNEIIVDPDNAHYISVDNSLYDKSLQTLVRCRADATDFIVPDTVTTIENGAFAGCSNLTSVTIPNSVTSIGGSAFGECTGLTSITIPDSVTSIEYSTFYNCTGLTSITIPDSVTTIEEYAFEGCTGLTSIIIPDSVTTIEDDAFFGCDNLASITIGAGLDSLEGFTSRFALGNLPTINISSENPYLTFIDGAVFNQAKDTLLDYLVTNIIGGSYTIPESVTSIGERAFQFSNLTSIIIPDSVTSIGNYAFYNCHGLTSLTLGNSVESIGDYAFDSCTSLTSITFNGDAPEIGEDAFVFIPSNAIISYYDSAVGFTSPTWQGVDTSILISPNLPVLDLENFYESNSAESIAIDATPTDGYPTNYTYKWYFNEFPIPTMFGGTNPTYTIDGASPSEGTWRVDVTNDTGTTSAEFAYRVFTDADSDGLSDYREGNILGTNPNLADSDGDDLSDYDEVNTHATNPSDSDSDDDGINDFDEVSITSTDPNNSDSDGDGVGDNDDSFPNDPSESVDTDSDGVGDNADGFPNIPIQDIINDVISNPSLYNLYSIDDIKDLRAGSTMIEVENGTATLSMEVEQSSDLEIWTSGGTTNLQVPVDPNSDTKFFRFKMSE